MAAALPTMGAAGPVAADTPPSTLAVVPPGVPGGDAGGDADPGDGGPDDGGGECGGLP